MKKWMFPVAVAVIAVIALGVYFFVAQESNDYNGSTYSADCSMNIDNDSFKLTYTEYEDNSYYSVRYIYSGGMVADKFVVDTYTVQYLEFGKVYGETTEKGVSVPLTDMIFFREVTGGYIVKDTFIKRSVTSVEPTLLYVTTQDAIDNAGCDIKLLKGSSVYAILSKTVVEIYSDGTTRKYAADSEQVGNADMDTVGTKKITVSYGNGKMTTMTLDIVPFIVDKNSKMDRGTSFEYAQSTGKIVLDKASDIGDVTAKNWDSTDGTRRTWISCGDYSTSIMTTFTSGSDRTISYAAVGMEHYIKAGTEIPVFQIHMELNNGTSYDFMSDDPDAKVSGYDKNVSGPQCITVGYKGSQFGFVLYSYNDSNTIPKEAHLINVNKTYDSRDSLLLYTEKGVNYSNYSIRYVMCDGTVKTTPLTPDIVVYSDDFDVEKRTTTTASIGKIIETYRYSEDVTVSYDTTEEVIKGSLTYANIIGDETSAYYKMETQAGTYYTSFGYRFSEFYVAHDIIDSSSYLSTNLRYVHDDTDSFTLYLANGYALDMNRSILTNSELVRYTIDHNDVKYAEFQMVMTDDDVFFFGGFGFAIGDEVTLTVTYNGQTGKTTAMDISKDGTKLAVGTFVYGEGVFLSDEIYDYVNNIGTVAVIMKFDDGRNDHFYSVTTGLKDLKFDVEEGYGVFVKFGQGMIPFVMPTGGITTSVTMYYLRA